MRIVLVFVLSINLLWVRSASSSKCLDLNSEDVEDCQGVSPCFLGEQIFASVFKDYTECIYGDNRRLGRNPPDCGEGPIPDIRSRNLGGDTEGVGPDSDCRTCEYDSNCPQGQYCFALGICSNANGIYAPDPEGIMSCDSSCSACYSDFFIPGDFICGCNANQDRCPNDRPCQGLNLYNTIWFTNNAPTPLNFFGVCLDDGVGGEGGGGDDPCLSAYSTVNVRGKAEEEPVSITTRMDELQIGDEIAISKDDKGDDVVYQELYAFGHLDVYSMARFLQVEMTSESGAGVVPLEISGEHLLFKYDAGVAGGVPVRADSIQVGDYIVGPQSGEKVQIKSVSKLERQGLYSPLVQDGTFLAGGMKVSSYTATSSDDAQFMNIGNFPILSHHMQSHMAISPFRILCQAGFEDLCEARNAAGQLIFAATGATTLQEQTLVGQVAVVASLVILPLYALEQFMLHLGGSSDMLLVSCGLFLLTASIISLLRKKFFKKA